MGTKHFCDRCSKTVKARSDLWVVEMKPAEKAVGFNDSKKFSKWELCESCKKSLYLQLMEYDG